MSRAIRLALPAIFLGMGLAACGGSDDDNSGSSVFRPDIGPASTRSASLMTTDDAAAAVAAVLQLQGTVVAFSENPAAVGALIAGGSASSSTNQSSNAQTGSGSSTTVDNSDSSGSFSSSSFSISAPEQRNGSAIPQQRNTANCSDGGSVNITRSGSVVTADFDMCASARTAGGATFRTVIDGLSSVDAASCGGGCTEGVVTAGSGGATLLSSATRTEGGSTTQNIAAQLIGTTHARRENQPGGGTSNTFTDIQLTIDLQDLIDGTQLTLQTNPAVTGATPLAVSVALDGDNELTSTNITGTYGVANLSGCQDGVLDVVTDMDISYTNSIPSGGQLTFTNAAMEMAQVTFGPPGSVTVTAGGSSQTYTVNQLSAFCNL